MVPKKDGGWRPIINLKRLNQFLFTTHFKMESILSLRDVLKKDNYMIKVDLKDAYITVPIHAPHRKYLQFLWNGTNYQFKVLPFGLSTAPRTFTKIMRPVMAKLREQGLRLIIYLDDILLMADSPEKLQYHTHILINLLQDLGFILNTKKCSLEPSQVIEFLGFLVNSRIMKLFLPQEKVDQIKKECRFSQRPCPPNWVIDCDNSCLSPSSATLQRPTEAQAQSSLDNSILRSTGRPGHGCNKRPSILDNGNPQMEWQTNQLADGRPHDNIRCFNVRLGSQLRNIPDRGPMDRGGGPNTHQPLGVESSLPSPSDVRIQTEQPTHPALD